MTHDAIVVGNGLFGATIARALIHRGLRVLTLDSREADAASPASGSLMKPTWFSGLGKEVTDAALAELYLLYPVQRLQFDIWPKLFKAEVLHVPTQDILSNPSHPIQVRSVSPGLVLGSGMGEFRAPLIVVAAGVHTSKLLPEVRVEGKAGMSFRKYGVAPTENAINPWAPYRQLVRFNERPGVVWCGDGTSIIPSNWTHEREERSRDRCEGWAKEEKMVGTYGVRPYCPGLKHYVREVCPGVWAATGGAKNGLVAAGWAAHTIVRSIT